MSKLLEQIKEVDDLLDNHLNKRHVNGNFSDDGLVNLEEALNSLKHNSRDLWRKVKGELIDRAKESGEFDEQDRPVLRGENFSLYAAASASTEVKRNKVLDHFKDRLKKAATSEDLDFDQEWEELGKLLKSQPFLKKQLNAAINRGELPEDSTERNEPDRSDHLNEAKRINISRKA